MSRSIPFLAILLFLLSYCKKSDGAGGSSGSGDAVAAAYQTTAQIGTAGGTIRDPRGGWTFVVPAGALTETKTITVTTNAAAVGSVPQEYATSAALLKLEPSGLTFLTPATLKVTYAQADMSEGGIEEKSQKQYYINDDSTVTAMATTINTNTNEITAQVPHFTITGTLKTNITKVNTGAITRASTVRKIANNLITYFNNLGTDVARNAEFQLAANNAMLLAFLNKLVQILGSDIFTAAFPTADFNGNGTVNSADPIAPVTGAAVTLVSSGSLYVSTNAGAINTTQFTWRSSASGTYAIRLNGTTCSDGAVVQSGAVTLNVDNTYSSINASSLITGDNDFRVCVTAGPNTTFYLVTIARDEVYPVSSASPAGGTYTTAQNVSMSCLDTGAAACAQIAYTTNGTDPTFDAAGNVTNGTLVAGMWMTPATGATTVKLRSRDDAGNVGSVVSYSFVGPLTITYAGNGSTSGTPPTDASTYASGTNAMVLGNTGTLVKTGSAFLGWNTAADGSGSSYSPGASLTLGSANVTLYPIWQFSLSSGATPLAGTWASIAYAAGVYVAVSNSGSVMTSTDGISWTSRTAAESNTWQSVTYGGGLFVAVSTSGTNRVMTSPDGITWTARAAAAANPWASVAYGGGKFVAVTGSGTNRVMTSADGVTWTSATAAEQNGWMAVTYGNGLFVAVAPTTGAHLVMTSPDGVVWTGRTAPEAGYWRSITYGNGTFVAVADFGSPNKVMTSTDGINWTARTTSTSGYWSTVTYGQGLFVALSSSGPAIIMVSPDGLSWTAQNSAEAINWSALGFGNGRFVSLSHSTWSRVMYSN